MTQLSNRSAHFSDSVIRRMTRVASQYGAVNLSQGFPDFAPPIEITNRLAEVAHTGPHQYAITWGAQNFREALARKQKHFSGISYDPNSEITVTCGSTEAMMAVMMAIINPGDKVAIFSPFYENYGADAILSGADPIYIPLVPPDFHYDRAVLEQAFRDGAKALILCNPSNPCGKVFTMGEMEEIAELAKRYDAFVITDEVYEYIIYDGNRHISMAALPGMYERTITCSSLSKTYSMTGWRLGYLIGPERVIEAAKKVHDFLTVGAAAPLQEAAVTGLKFGPEYYEWLKDLYTEKRDYLCGRLEQMGLSHTTPQGSYFVLVDISGFLEKPEFTGWTDLEFCEWMIKKYGVAAVPGSSFFKEPVNNYIRLHFSRGKETLEAAADRLEKMAKDYGFC